MDSSYYHYYATSYNRKSIRVRKRNVHIYPQDKAISSPLCKMEGENWMTAVLLNNVKRHSCYSQRSVATAAIKWTLNILNSGNFLADKYHTVANGVQKHILCPAELSPALTLTAAGISRCWQSGLTPTSVQMEQGKQEQGAPSPPALLLLSSHQAQLQHRLFSPQLIASRPSGPLAECCYSLLSLVYLERNTYVLQNSSRPASDRPLNERSVHSPWGQK